MVTKEEFYAKWSSLHSDAPVSGVVAWWLKISYRFGLIATLLRISPNALTILGLISAVITAFTATSWWALVFLVFSLFCDGIDGSVAIFQKRDSAWGATLDSVVDRVSEALWLYALLEGIASARHIATLSTMHHAYIWICGGVSVN